MAAAGFLSLAYTFRHNEHIRVTLLLNAVSPKWRYSLNLMSLLIAALLAICIAYFSVNLVVQSYEFNDLSVEEDATPLWIPQLGMAIGCVIFAIALIEEFVLTLFNKGELDPLHAASSH